MEEPQQKDFVMLTLGRKSGEAVQVCDNVTVTAYTEKGSNDIRLVFDAPRDAKILREELIKRPVDQAGLAKLPLYCA
jgi:carbon storage regulator CsrA